MHTTFAIQDGIFGMIISQHTVYPCGAFYRPIFVGLADWVVCPTHKLIRNPIKTLNNSIMPLLESPYWAATRFLTKFCTNQFRAVESSRDRYNEPVRCRAGGQDRRAGAIIRWCPMDLVFT